MLNTQDDEKKIRQPMHRMKYPMKDDTKQTEIQGNKSNKHNKFHTMYW